MALLTASHSQTAFHLILNGAKQKPTIYHESFEAEKFCGFRSFMVLRETFSMKIFQLLSKSERL